MGIKRMLFIIAKVFIIFWGSYAIGYTLGTIYKPKTVKKEVPQEVKQPIDPVREQIIGRYTTVRLDGGCEFIINTYWGSTQAVHHPKCDNHWYSIFK
jgi:hypothetical protein